MTPPWFGTQSSNLFLLLEIESLSTLMWSLRSKKTCPASFGVLQVENWLVNLPCDVRGEEVRSVVGGMDFDDVDKLLLHPVLSMMDSNIGVL